jgi:hypothetical protein
VRVHDRFRINTQHRRQCTSRRRIGGLGDRDIDRLGVRKDKRLGINVWRTACQVLKANP